MWFAALLGIILAKVLSIAGIGGLVAGLFIRSLGVAAAIGTACGVVDTAILASMRYTGVEASSWIVAIAVGAAMAALGWVIRGRRLAR